MELKKEVVLLRKENQGLRTLVEMLTKRVEELESISEENKKLKKELKEVKEKLAKKSKPDFVKEDIKKKKKKTGRKKGHKGHGRYSPGRIDETKEHACDECPECGGHNLSDVQEVRERTTTDIPGKQEVINTKHLIERKYCKDCKRMVEARVPDALPNAQFGLRLMLLVLILKLDIRVPSNKIMSILSTLYNMTMSDGEVYNILEQLSNAFGDYYGELKKKIIDALTKNIDETGWRINGQNHWVWIFINKEVALYAIRRQRSSAVPVSILGNQEGKTHINDRLEAYNRLSEVSGSSQQVCWTHLLRNARDLAKYFEEAGYIRKRLKYIYAKAKEGKTSKEQLLKWIDRIGERTYTSSMVFKFVKAICRKHRDNLFRFVDNPEIDSTNNRAERGLRHAVVMRKISNGSRSEKGAEITGRLLSVTQTIKMNHSNLMDGLIGLLQMPK